MSEISLTCICGKVRGIARNISPEGGTRLVCYCSDCRAFILHLGGDKLLDQYGGADNFQMAIANLEIIQGIEYIRCLRLTEKGMFRWYTDCCKTPIGNTLSAGVPFIALFHAFIQDRTSLDKNLGPVRAYLKTNFATSPVPFDRAKSPWFKAISRAFYKLVIWKIMGLEKPNPFFDNNGRPITEPVILSRQTVS